MFASPTTTSRKRPLTIANEASDSYTAATTGAGVERTFTMNLGAASPGRRVFIAVAGGNTYDDADATFTVTLDSNPATAIYETDTNSAMTDGFAMFGLFSIDEDSSTSGTVGVTPQSAAPALIAVATFSVYGDSYEVKNTFITTEHNNTIHTAMTCAAGNYLFCLGYGSESANDRSAGIAFDAHATAFSETVQYDYSSGQYRWAANATSVIQANRGIAGDSDEGSLLGIEIGAA